MLFLWPLLFICVQIFSISKQYEDVLFENGNNFLEEIHIGGLFEDINSSSAMAFEAAVQYVNERRLIPVKDLVHKISYVPANDSFQVERRACRLLESGVSAILGPGSRATSYHIQSLCDTLEIPHLTTRWDPSQSRSSCLINLYPHPNTLSQAVTDVVKGFNWKGFTVLYDDYEALMRIHGLVKLADDKGYLVTVRQLQLKPVLGYRSILKEIKYSEEKNIVIQCSVEILHDVLIQAQQVGLMGADYNYFITSLDFHTINYESFIWSGTNMTSIRLISPDNPYVREIVGFWSTHYQGRENDVTPDYPENMADITEGLRILTEPAVKGYPSTTFFSYPLPYVDSALTHDAVILMAKALQYLNVQAKQPANCQQQIGLDYGYSIINYMRLSEFQGMSGLVKFDHEGFRTDFILEIIELTEEGLKKKGYWNKTLNIIPPHIDRPYVDDDFDDLRNTTFVVLITLIHPYVMLKESRSALVGNDRYEGFGVDLITELSIMAGFNFTFKEHADKNSGNPTELPNGTRIWNGMIGEVLAGRADLAIADITITRERERDADFTHPFMNLGISILHRSPRKAPPSLFSFLDPFSAGVWACMMSAYIGVSLLLFIMARISPHEWNNPYPCLEEPGELENQFSLINSFWFTVGSLMQQGSDIAPTSVSTRMAASMWWFFTLIMVSSYTAQLASFLTVETIVRPFKDIEELANQDVIKYGAKKGGATVNFFRDSKDPIYQKIYKFMEKNPDCMMMSNEEGVNRVLSETNYAFFMESTSIEYEVERKCDLAQVGGLLDNKGYGIVMKQNSTYRNILSRYIVKLQERGTLTQLKNKWWTEKRGGGSCLDDNKVSEASELSLDNTGGVFVVLLGGCIFATLIAIFELVCHVHGNQDKSSFKEELKEELKFIMRWRERVKPIRKRSKSEAASSDMLNESLSTKKSLFYVK